jgi:hypothetical protein
MFSWLTGESEPVPVTDALTSPRETATSLGDTAVLLGGNTVALSTNPARIRATNPRAMTQTRFPRSHDRRPRGLVAGLAGAGTVGRVMFESNFLLLADLAS